MPNGKLDVGLSALGWKDQKFLQRTDQVSSDLIHGEDVDYDNYYYFCSGPVIPEIKISNDLIHKDHDYNYSFF